MKNFLKNKKGFTLIELIVVIVIMAILGGIGFSALSNYIASANLSKQEQKFSELRNGIGPKFTKSFIDNGVSWSVEAPSASAGYLSGSVALIVSTLADSDLTSTANQIKLNGVSVKLIESSFPLSTGEEGTILANETATSNDVLVVNELPTGEVVGTYYQKITDLNICTSKAFTEKPDGAVRYIENTNTAKPCMMATKPADLKLLGIN